MRVVKDALLSLASSTGGLRYTLRHKARPPMILLYHGVTRAAQSDGLRNCEGKHLGAGRFVEHLRVLQRSSKVIGLDEMVDGLYAGRDLRNAVAITFDDGYENNVVEAAPLLSDFNMPATFFLSTGFISKTSFIWPDLIEMAFDRTSKPRLEIAEGVCALPIRTLVEKSRALRFIKEYLKRQPTQRVARIVQELVDRLGVAIEAACGDYRFMSWDQARALVRAGFSIGAHTVTHPVLTQIALPDACREIIDSRDAVLRETGQCSTTFCFPNGKSNDFNPALQAFCRENFRAALSTNRGAATVADVHELKRISPAGRGNGENIEWALLTAMQR